jgi:hypothetical protein
MSRFEMVRKIKLPKNCYLSTESIKSVFTCGCSDVCIAGKVRINIYIRVGNG